MTSDPDGETPRRARTVRRSGRRAAAVLATPLAPWYGLRATYLSCHMPRRRPRRGPESYRLAPQEFSAPVGAAARTLRGWLCRGDPDRVVVVGHGLGLSRAHSLTYAAFLHRAGYTVALFDFRNHGDSFTDPAAWRFAARFTEDAVAVVDRLRAMPDLARARFALYGFSFSCFPLLYAAARRPGTVHAVVCDSGPAPALPTVLGRFLHSGLLEHLPHAVRQAPALPIVEAVYRRCVPLIFGTPPPWPSGAARTVPTLLIGGEDDAIVPVADLHAVSALLPDAHVVLVPAAGHLEAIFREREMYTTTVRSFLDAALNAEPGAVTGVDDMAGADRTVSAAAGSEGVRP